MKNNKKTTRKKPGTDFDALQKAVDRAHKAIGHKLTLKGLEEARERLWGKG